MYWFEERHWSIIVGYGSYHYFIIPVHCNICFARNCRVLNTNKDIIYIVVVKPREVLWGFSDECDAAGKYKRASVVDVDFGAFKDTCFWFFI